MSIGTRLVELRNGKGLTRVQLAEDLGIPMTTLRNYETDAREPGHKFLLEASRYFGVTTDYILENEKAPESYVSETAYATPEERELLSLYNQMNDDRKKLLLSTARTYAGNPAMQKESSCEEAI